MSAPARLAAYGAGLVVLFCASFAIGAAVVPQDVVDDWNRSAVHSDRDDGSTTPAGSTGHSEQDGH